MGKWGGRGSRWADGCFLLTFVHTSSSKLQFCETFFKGHVQKVRQNTCAQHTCRHIGQFHPILPHAEARASHAKAYLENIYTLVDFIPISAWCISRRSFMISWQLDMILRHMASSSLKTSHPVSGKRTPVFKEPNSWKERVWVKSRPENQTKNSVL